MISLCISVSKPLSVRGFSSPVTTALQRVPQWPADPAQRRAHRQNLAHSMLGYLLDRSLCSDDFSPDPSGKPQLRDASCHASWSYSGPFVFLALSFEQPLGVDIEVSRVIPEAPALLARYVDPPDGSRRDLCDIELASVEFLRWWTRMEASSKAAGCRMVDVLDHPSVRSFDPELLTPVGMHGELIGAIASPDALSAKPTASPLLETP